MEEPPIKQEGLLHDSIELSNWHRCTDILISLKQYAKKAEMISLPIKALQGTSVNPPVAARFEFN